MGTGQQSEMSGTQLEHAHSQVVDQVQMHYVQRSLQCTGAVMDKHGAASGAGSRPTHLLNVHGGVVCVHVFVAMVPSMPFRELVS